MCMLLQKRDSPFIYGDIPHGLMADRFVCSRISRMQACYTLEFDGLVCKNRHRQSSTLQKVTFLLELNRKILCKNR